MDILYDGTMQAIQNMTYTLTTLGYTVEMFAPNNPKVTNDVWVKARKMYPASVLETGNPLDFRAMVKDSHGKEMFLHVEENRVLQALESGDLQVFEPPSVPRPTGISVWVLPQTNQPTEIFSWDGSELQFSGLVSFFQLKGNLMNKLEPVLGAGGVPTLEGTATIIERGFTYNFTMTKDSVFCKNEVGGIATLSKTQLQQTARQIG